MTHIGFLMGWMFSVAATWTLGLFLTGKYHWYVVVVKDSFIAFLVAGFIIAAFVGR